MSDLSSEVTRRLPCAAPIPWTLLSEQRGECLSAQIPGGALWGPLGDWPPTGSLEEGSSGPWWRIYPTGFCGAVLASVWPRAPCGHPPSPDLTPSLPFLRMHPFPRPLHISPTPSRSPGSPFQSLRLGCFAFTSFQSLCQRPSPWPAFKIQKPGIQLPPYLCSAVSFFPPGSKCCLIWLLLE
uniref:Uncharacterized protein n=1 Tax=Myotis myotis TaxID=51298 RepID=A0A7J7S2L8_MYOMY|nr:hypothetical protein mMyoMyo1_010040 [Myotis myotis]